MTQAEIVAAILAKNGWKHQYTIALEELAELMKELTKAIRDKGSHANICEEIADVEICITQIKATIRRSKLQVQLFKRFKLERLEKLYIEGDEK
jgi:NTP pyrophosphatase (non-canonical NTP hydrolase)